VLPRDARSASVVDRHRESIADALRARGLVVRTDVGLSEFRVDLSISRRIDPETPVMAVLLDGPAWARRRTVGDRDGLPVEVLGDMLRWPAVERVWLPSWLADSTAVLDRLVAAVEAVPQAVPGTVPAAVPAPIVLPTAAIESFKGVAALRSAVTASVAVPAPTAPRPAPKAAARKAAGPAALDGEAQFVPWIPKVAGDKSVLDDLPAAKAARVVRRVLTAGIKAEGPVHVDRLAKLTLGAFGLNRVAESRKEALLSLLPPSAVVDGYLWPDGVDPASWTGFRRQMSSTDRPLEHVAPEELANAMVALCRAGAGMRRDELLTQTAAVFGYKRRSPTVTPLLEAGVAWAVERGRLVEQPSGLLTV
jgi:REase_MTES_1575